RVSGTVDIVKTLNEFWGFIAHAIFLNQTLRNSEPTDGVKIDFCQYITGRIVPCSVTPIDITASNVFSKEGGISR
ncbi:hypothetical protein C0993_009287, partial [Termitomyces sp. T159_Od127]